MIKTKLLKIFEERFSTTSDALLYLENAHWSYVGKKGYFQKYDEFHGSTISQKSDDINTGSHERAFTARLAPNGYLSIYVERKNNLISISELPEYVWPSLDVYEYMYNTVTAVNKKLNEIKAEIHVDFSHRPKEYHIYSNQGAEVLEVITSPLYALRSKYAANILPDLELDQFNLDWFNKQN